MSDMPQLVVWIGNSQCATLRVVSFLSAVNLYDKLNEAYRTFMSQVIAAKICTAARGTGENRGPPEVVEPLSFGSVLV